MRAHLTSESQRKRATKHGMHGHRLYQVYTDMMLRCYNREHAAYKWYGARGIGVCAEWRNSREDFFLWALVGWAKGLTLDRENNDGDYTPENCRWVTSRVNSRNSRSTHLTLPDAAVIYDLAHRGVNQTLVSALYGISRQMVSRIKLGKGWSDVPLYLGSLTESK